MATSCGSAEQISTGGTSVPLKSPRRAVTSDSEAAAGTRRYYDDNARIYSEASVWLPLNDAFEPFVARLTAGARVLDLGCGAGRDLRALSLRGFRSIGLDVSLPLVELAAQFSGCPVIQGDMRTIPFEDGAFGGIWASASLLHLRRREIPSAVREVVRVLASGGYFFSSVKKGAGEGPDSKGRWFTYFEEDEWLAVLADVGLAVVQSSATQQASGTLEKNVSVDWFACITKKR